MLVISRRRMWLSIALALVMTVASAGAAIGQGPVGRGAGVSLAALASQLLTANPGSHLDYHRGTGYARFFGLDQRAVMHAASRNASQSLSPEAAGADFLAAYGPLFGADGSASALVLTGKESPGPSRSVLTYEQRIAGLPVIGGELRLQVVGGTVVAANGELAPSGPESPSATISATLAGQRALEAVGKAHGLALDSLSSSEPELAYYCPALLGPGPAQTRLVWHMEVTSADVAWLRELVLVDAHLGNIALHFNQLPTGKDRQTYDAHSSASLPGTLVRSEGQGPVGTPADADRAHDYAGLVYDFYFNRFGRDSLDGNGMTLISTVRYCPSGGPCPYDNAFWDGSQMVYGEGMVADDVVGHEMTHAVTQYTSRLFYYYQSGAINEAISDIFGELFDQEYGVNSPGDKWLIGEDLPGGAIRNMSNPPQYSQPDRMSSPYYSCDLLFTDNGGVHVNSGVLNKAAYLISDGGAFNGYAISGLGLDKTARIFYELETHLLTSASDYADVHDLLPQACLNLEAGGVTTGADCGEVAKAVNATEMDSLPALCAVPEAEACPAGATCSDLFHDDLENPASGNWATHLLQGAYDEWYYPQNPNPYPGWDPTYATSGSYNFWGYDQTGVAIYDIAMTRDVALPAGQPSYLRFNQAYDFEVSGGYFCDGGVVEYSTDHGLTWHDAGSLFDANGYGGTLYHPYWRAYTANPLAGRQAFVGTSYGYTSSRLNLSRLAGSQVRFRFVIATDYGGGGYGWFIDDIAFFTTGPAPTVTTTPQTPEATASPPPTALPTSTPTPTPTPIRRFLPLVRRNWAGARLPNDPAFAQQWNLTDARMPAAWAYSVGENGPIVAVCDTGADLQHPDLVGNLVPGYDFVSSNPAAQDDNGHGTHVAGIIGAVGNNAIGVSGINWRARLMPVKILGSDGSGDSVTAWLGIRWAVDQGAKVINLSFGTPYPDPLLQDAVSYALAKGVVVVAAAGNVYAGSDITMGGPCYPAAYPGVLGVGATDSNDAVAWFSNQAAFVDVTAPGVSVLSTVLRRPGYSDYGLMSGTSMAAPHVAGLAALLLAANPRLSQSGVTNLITATARDMGAPGWDPAYGNGLIDAGRAIGGAMGATTSLSGPQAWPMSAGPALLPQALPREGSYRPGVVVLRISDRVSWPSLARSGLAADAVADQVAPGLIQLRVPPGGEMSLMRELAGQPGVELVSLDYVLKAM